MAANARVAVIIVAAGSSSRFGGDVPKPYLALHGKTVLEHSLDVFAAHPAIDTTLVVVHGDHEKHFAPLKEARDLWVVRGGKLRQQSVYAGLDALADHPPHWVLVHDAARPHLSPALIDRVLEGLEKAPAVVPAIAVKDTIKQQNAQGVTTLPRDSLRAVQTPQGFHYAELLAAHLAAGEKEYTDDAAICEAAGMPVLLVDGDEANIKITTPQDWERGAFAGETRIGCGYDVHALMEDAARPLMLCGVEVPSALALEGHSDADAPLHALVDALLGAMGEGDIGEHFPPTDARWKNADSADFVAEAMRRLRARGGAVINADITIIAEAPKLMAHKAAMRARVAQLLGAGEARVNIKATTSEGLGFVGRKEGIAAQAVVSITCQ